MNYRKTYAAAALTGLALLVGCSTSPVTDDEFGDSVRQMVRSQQIYVVVDEEPVTGNDGQRLETVLESYRSNERPAAVEAPPSILINSSN